MPSGWGVWLLIAGAPCSLCLVTPPHPWPTQRPCSPVAGAFLGELQQAPCDDREPPTACSSLFTPPWSIRRELTAQTPLLQGPLPGAMSEHRAAVPGERDVAPWPGPARGPQSMNQSQAHFAFLGAGRRRGRSLGCPFLPHSLCTQCSEVSC